MGYGKRFRRRNDRTERRKGSARPRLALAGAIILAIGILFLFYEENVVDFDTRILVGVILVPAGTIMLLFSMSKRNQNRFAKGIERTKKAFDEPCHCCKCTNCDRNHNHWTHG